MGNAAEQSEKRRFDDLVRSERYFTATLLPLLLFCNNLDGVREFCLGLVDKKAKTERDSFGEPSHDRGTPDYNDFKDVEVITEFHIARDLKAARLPSIDSNVKPSEEAEPERQDAPDVVIVAGQELVVCEGKFFTFFSDYDVEDLNEQLRSQRRQVKLLFQEEKFRHIRAYRHVAILPFCPTTTRVDADCLITWGEIGNLAGKLMGQDHYVTVRLRNAVKRHEDDRDPDTRIRNFDGKLSFKELRKKCEKPEHKMQVGYVGGEAALFKMSLPEAEKKQWKWRNPETNKGRIIPENWLTAERWLEIVESAHGFGGRRA
jgi:hypothetical protein